MANNSKTRNEENSHIDVPIYKSELEDIDFALYNFVNDSMDLRTKKNTGFEKTPVIWAGAERAHNIKNDNITRDRTGMIILPVVAIERSGVKKAIKNRGIPYASVDPISDLQGGYLIINKVIKQDKTSNFANADAHRLRDQSNFPLYRNKKNKKIVYETLTIPLPIYEEVEYKITLRTEYQEQMNDLLAPFIRSSNAHKRVMIVHGPNKYEAFIDENYEMTNNISNYESNEKKYETVLSVNVLGYLIGDGKNEVRPRVARRENAVQVRFARERVIVDGDDGDYRF